MALAHSARIPSLESFSKGYAMPPVEAAEVTVNVSHERLQAALDVASKEKLVLALRALVTAIAWTLTEAELRTELLAISHSEKSTHEEVYNALVNGA
jgi:hypothetical protein